MWAWERPPGTLCPWGTWAHCPDRRTCPDGTRPPRSRAPAPLEQVGPARGAHSSVTDREARAQKRPPPAGPQAVGRSGVQLMGVPLRPHQQCLQARRAGRDSVHPTWSGEAEAGARPGTGWGFIKGQGARTGQPSGQGQLCVKGADTAWGTAGPAGRRGDGHQPEWGWRAPPLGAELGHPARLGLGKLARSLEAPSRGSLGEP